MTLLAFIIPERRSVLFSSNDAILIGGALLLVALVWTIANALFGKKSRPSFMRSYAFCLLLVAGIGLIAVAVVATMQDLGDPICELGG